MGYHTQRYYNTKCYKGNTQKTGYAWWYDQSLEDPNNPSHFEGFIPLALMRKEFGWNAEESIKLVATFEIDGKEYEVPVKNFKALGRGDWIVNGIPDTEEEGADKILSIPTLDYGTHQLKDVFIKNVSELVGGEENIGLESFGSLKWGRRAFASISVPDHFLNDASGLQFRPILTIVTSFDSTISTKYVRTYGIPVCDNTVNYELARAGEKDGHFVLRHSKNSAARLMDAKRVLGLLSEQGDDMDKWITEQAKIEVSEPQFIKWLDVMVPVPEPTKKTVTVTSIQGEQVQTEKISYAGQTRALNTRDKLVEMWDRDARVAPWKNTRLGIFQLWNTFQHHETTVKATKALGKDSDNQVVKTNAKIRARIESNMDRLLNVNNKNSFQSQDMVAMDAIVKIQNDELQPVKIPVGAGKK